MLSQLISKKNGIALLCLCAFSFGQISFADDQSVEGTFISNGDLSFVLVPNSDKNVKNTVESKRTKNLAKKAAAAAAVATAAVLLAKVGPKALIALRKKTFRGPKAYALINSSFSTGKINANQRDAERAALADLNATNTKLSMFSKSKKANAFSVLGVLASAGGFAYSFVKEPKFAAHVVDFAKTNESEVPRILIDSAEYANAISDLDAMGFRADAVSVG